VNSRRGADGDGSRELEQLIASAAVAERLGLNIGTVANWRLRGIGPPWIRLSRRAVRYRVRDLDAWIARNVRTSTRRATA
jgi:hypothetical protein